MYLRPPFSIDTDIFLANQIIQFIDLFLAVDKVELDVDGKAEVILARERTRLEQVVYWDVVLQFVVFHLLKRLGHSGPVFATFEIEIIRSQFISVKYSLGLHVFTFLHQHVAN